MYNDHWGLIAKTITFIAEDAFAEQGLLKNDTICYQHFMAVWSKEFEHIVIPKVRTIFTLNFVTF